MQQMKHTKNSRRLRLVFVESGVAAEAELLDAEAPSTCDALWAALVRPMRAFGMHARWVGAEVMIDMPSTHRTFDGAAIPLENATCFPLPGDLMFFHFPAHAWAGVREEIYEFGIVYGRDTRMFIPTGWSAGNRFGRITDNLDAFAAMCANVHREGWKEIEVSRIAATSVDSPHA
jgi:hypothetical protein